MYKTDDGQIEIEVQFEDENVWISQKSMAKLFDTTKQNISLHIKNIFDENELNENSVVKENLTTAYCIRTISFQYFARNYYVL